ncbi:hypothetical protein F6455_14815 [Proteobacteria bacterium 005FR1]|nr:hypothetical protein [Proteobacteria bacterium 005FR1]
MDITYTRRQFTSAGLGDREGPFTVALGQFLFVEAACYFGVLPPFGLLKNTLAKGRVISAEGAVLEWKPLRLSRMQYEELAYSIKDNPQWGGEVDDRFRGSRLYWERWAMLRSVGKISAMNA